MLESLAALAIFASITSVFLSAIRVSRASQEEELRQEEVLNVAQMAVQTGRKELTINGVSVQVQKDLNQIIVWSEGKEVARVDKQ